jgi:hypothetical protein
VVLPPFVVSAMRIDKHPWRYGSVPGMEILTRASDEETAVLVDAYRRGWWIENKLLSQDWLKRPPIPYTVIVDDTDPETVRQGELPMPPLARTPGKYSLGWGALPPPDNTTGWFRAGDYDTAALGGNLYDRPSISHGPTGLDRLDRCAPPLPSWLMAGIIGRFGLYQNRANVRTFRSSDSRTGNGVIFRGARWISDEETKRLMKEGRHQKTEIPFIPLAQFFAEPPVQGEKRLLWESEAGLLVRWGLFGDQSFLNTEKKTADQRLAFVQFVQRTRYEAVTEKMFAECFGRGFEAMEQILIDYLKKTLAEPIEIKLNFPQDFPEPRLKLATADQIGRILGDWLRMEGNRQEQPAMRAKFLDAAGRMLTRAYKMDNGLPPGAEPKPEEEKDFRPIPRKAGEPVVHLEPFVVLAERIHDPGLQAVFGLYEHDIGDDEKARAFLEKAAKAGVVRPTAYLVLAQLRQAEAAIKPLGRDGKLSAAQADFILEPAKVALRSSATVEAWGQIVETLARCEVKPSSADLEIIVAGVSQFPRDISLARRTALLCIQAGNPEHALELIDRSIPFVPDEDTRQKFQTLRTSLSASAHSR